MSIFNNYDPLSHFNLSGRENDIQSIVEFVQSYRRGIFLIEGVRGVGKTRLVKEAFKRANYKRHMPKSKKESDRTVLPVWVDMTQLKITTPIIESIGNTAESETGSSASTQLKQEPISISDKEFLISIIQAVIRQLSPHTSLRKEGRGLKSKLGEGHYYFSWPRKSKNNIMLISVMGMAAGALFAAQDALAHLALLLKLPWGISILGPIIITLLSWRLLRFSEIRHLKNRVKQIYFMTFSNEYSKKYENSNSNKQELILPPIRKIGLKIDGALSRSKNAKMIATFSTDIPHLLYQLDILVFQYHRIGIEPIIIIDELDKLNAGKAFLKKLSGNHVAQNGCFWLWDNEAANFVDWSENFGLIIFFDILLRFKESLADKFSIILIGDQSIRHFMAYSRQKGLSYHTIVKEELFIQPIFPRAWSEYFKILQKCKLRSNAFEDTCSLYSPDDCPTQSGEESVRSIPCEKWCYFLWILGKGNYNELLVYYHRYRNIGWKKIRNTGISSGRNWSENVLKND